MSYFTDTVTHTLAGDWGTGASITVNYPSGKTGADYAGSDKHKIISRSIATLEGNDVIFTFGPTNISIKHNSGRGTYAAGEIITIELHRPATDVGRPEPRSAMMSEVRTFKIEFGTPATADADGAVASQAATSANGLATGINGALAADGVATFDVPRNVVAAWTGTAVLTVTGTDEYGNVVVESSGSGTSLTGKKAFKTVTGISVSANVTGLTVGTGVLLGLPMFLESAADVLVHYQDNAVAGTAGTVVAGVRTAATATTGDVRGTLSPNAAPNGSLKYSLLVASKGAADIGVPQFAG